MGFNWFNKFQEADGEYRDEVFVLGGREGTLWKDLEVNNEEMPIRFYVKVVGFVDEIASMRSWGHITLNKYVERPNIIYRNKIVKKIVRPKVIKTPKTIVEKLLSRFGYYKKI